jgi:hypothetical protein
MDAHVALTVTWDGTDANASGLIITVAPAPPPGFSRSPPSRLVLLDPVGQGARMSSQVSSYLGDRFVGLSDDPDSSLTELTVELPPLLGHDT